MKITCMAWGICTGAGWYDLIHKLCEDIVALEPGLNFKAAQVKEKFGGLSFYCDGYPEDRKKQKAIGKLIIAAGEESYKICEMCGSRENITVEGSWIQTLCSNCRNSKKDFEEKLNVEYKATSEQRTKKGKSNVEYVEYKATSEQRTKKGKSNER